ncbi:hypothetical protein QJS04_geneDACA022312 [Acorus gramineus]|uniref:Uncharacterized protein n=1 Tax=Acorus gramineus TaxID=55184 RepID=A0AAV9B9X7_ACOGR|nr:hypothetical protein QJS04_geneDACA022312 [Acorus gramineus]
MGFMNMDRWRRKLMVWHAKITVEIDCQTEVKNDHVIAETWLTSSCDTSIFALRRVVLAYGLKGYWV